jgi:hypothetical protein
MILASESGKINIPPSPEYPRAPILYERINPSTSESAMVTPTFKSVSTSTSDLTYNSTQELIDALRADLVKLKGESPVHIPSEDMQGIVEDLDKNLEILASLCGT